MHAFPSIENAPSNSICHKAGSTLQGQVKFEYPPGQVRQGNDWRLDLLAVSAGARSDTDQTDRAQRANTALQSDLRRLALHKIGGILKDGFD